MDREIVEQKLESLRRCLLRIETKCRANAATLAADFDLQDIVHSIVRHYLVDLSDFAKVVTTIGAESRGGQ